ncbi:hypothetical protein C2S52_013532 [Perilla frutescens var. hirtella]|nr:hypothetical protein C2S52_013532 [Perilla frutescens var. hirtella]
MRDSQQDMKRKTSYEQWTKEQSDLLLELMVDVAGREWRDNSGIFGKAMVEERILPILNEKLGCNKTYNNYQSHLKWFKNHWLSYLNLMRFSSGFGYNHTTKKFTASDEVWDAYLEAHSKDANLCYGECLDYEDLEIVVENALSQDEPPSFGSTPPSGFPEVSEVSTQRRTQPKRSRAQYEATSGSTEKYHGRD